MSVTNLQSPTSGQPVANQFEIRVRGRSIFKSYDTIIAIRDLDTGYTLVNKDYWDSSATTLKYFKVWLGTSKTKKELAQYMDSTPEYNLCGELLITETYYGLVA